MIFPHPGSWISDPGSWIQKQQQKRGVKKNLLSYLFFSYKFYNIVNYYIFEMLDKKMWLNFQRSTERLPKKLSQSFKNMGLGSGIRNKPIPDPDPGSMGQKGTGSRIRNTAKNLASKFAFFSFTSYGQYRTYMKNDTVLLEF